jgi:hypothetical protein
MNIHAIPMPKPIRAPKPPSAPKLPKLAGISAKALSGTGWKVQHTMTTPPHPKPFVFQNPAKMVSHLKRIQANEWRQPSTNEGSGISKDLNDNTSVE